MPSTPHSNVEDVYPLSFLQEGLLYHHELNPSSPCYWNRVSCRFTGQLSPELLRRAWQTTLDRYPPLRTRFVRDKNGRALQVVRRNVELDWTYADLSHEASNQRESDLEELFAVAACAPNLKSDTLCRVVLAKVDVDDYRFCWCYHHIVLDGWSEAIVWEDVLKVYANGAHSDSPVSFASYIAWLGDSDRVADMTFWEEYLRGYTPTSVTSVRSTSKSIPASDRLNIDDSGSVMTLTLASEHVATLDSFVRTAGLTFNTILQAAWALVLGAEAGRSDIVIGTILADRAPSLEGASEIVGLLLATLPVRFDAGSSQKLVDWLNSRQDEIATITQHSRVSLPDIQRAVDTPADQPLFDVLFALDNSAAISSTSSQLPFRIAELTHKGDTNYALAISIDHHDGIRIKVGYDCDRHESTWIMRILHRFEAVLDHMLAEPDQQVCNVSLLTAAETQAHQTHCRTVSDVSTEFSVVHMLENSIRLQPHNTAVEFGKQSLTYAELGARIQTISQALREKGVVPGQAVGFYAERNLDLVAAIAAIWRIGAIYLPLDPAHPPKRNERYASIAEIVCCICDNIHRHHAVQLAPTIVLENLTSTTGGIPRPIVTKAQDRAYVIFTSGSTGTPNGVPIRHASLANMLSSCVGLLSIKEQDRMLAITNVSFDISLFELFLPLVTSSTVRIAANETIQNTQMLAAEMDVHSITHQFATPAVWEALLLSNWQGSDLLRVYCGGDTLRKDLAARLLENSAELWNLYGPTETAIASTGGRIESASELHIGQPLRDTVLQVVDGHNRLLPPGVLGELCIGGIGVSEGYLNNPELNVTRFVSLNKIRYFRTGDLATRREEGVVVHHGRIDHQIKLRGFRIEPGEIETLVNSQPSVGACVVVVRITSSGDKRLIAYISPKSSAQPDAEVIRAALANYLPSYMIPVDFVCLDTFPMTASGKIDRNALPEPTAHEVYPAQLSLSSREARVASIWSDLLNQVVTDPHSEFYALGGHSLLLAKLANVLSREYDCQVSIADLATHPTVSQQAELLRLLQSSEVEASLPQIEPSFFGPNQALFGILQRSVPDQDPKQHAVLIAGPLLSEGIRAHFPLQQLSLRLAQRGFDVFRFDYRGMGNSLGNMASVSPTAWQEDVGSAIEHLTGMLDGRSLSLIAVRFALNLVSGLVTKPIFEHVVAWDPVFTGPQWQASLKRNQIETAEHLSIDPAENEFQGHRLSEVFLADLASRTFGELRANYVTVCYSSDNDIATPSGFGDQQIEIACEPHWTSRRSKPIFSAEVIDTLCNAIH